MPLVSPTPYPAALRYLRQQGLMPTTADSRRLEQLHADITERAFFSAQVDRADILQRAKDLTERMVNPAADGPGQKIGKPAFRREMRRILSAIGYEVDPDGDLKDITSTKRLNLISSMVTGEAHGYGQFETANKPGALKYFPCQELFRLETKKEPRPWLDKWRAAGGTLYEGRMIALKDDPIWTKPLSSGGFNRFGRAWPPFDFNSGMWVKPVSRAEAVRLGVCGKDDTPKRQKRTYNEEAQQSCRPLSPELQKRLNSQFSNRFRVDDSGVVSLLPVDVALKAALNVGRLDPAHPHGKVNIGPVPSAVRDLSPFELKQHDCLLVDTNHLLHTDKHQADDVPITDADILSLPELLQAAEASPLNIRGEDSMAVRSGSKEIILEQRKRRLAVITMYNFKEN